MKTFAAILLSMFLCYTGYNCIAYLLEDADVVELAEEEEESEEESAEEYKFKLSNEEYGYVLSSREVLDKGFVHYCVETYEDVVISNAAQPPEWMS